VFIFGSGLGNFTLVGSPNEYHPAGVVLCNRGQYVPVRGGVTVQINTEFVVQFFEQVTNRLSWTERGISAGMLEAKDPDMISLMVHYPVGRERGAELAYTANLGLVSIKYKNLC
jgi:hypothetical protein